MKTIKLSISLFLVAALSSSLWAQQVFDTPEKAVLGLQQAVQAETNDTLKVLLGPESEKLMADEQESTISERRNLLASLMEERWALAESEEGHLLRLGFEGWPFPIPITKSEQGFVFDLALGSQEIMNRRIGANELAIIETCYRLGDAQEDFRLSNPSGDGIRKYTERLKSSDGKRDGLYWETSAGENSSPLEKFFVNAWEYAVSKSQDQPWFGYRFKFLKAQGENAPGGSFDYTVNGHLLAGWAVVASPSRHRETGVMTFLTNQNGVIYQKDLGDQTEAFFKAATTFNPDETWDIVTERI